MRTSYRKISSIRRKSKTWAYLSSMVMPITGALIAVGRFDRAILFQNGYCNKAFATMVGKLTYLIPLLLATGGKYWQVIRGA